MRLLPWLENPETQPWAPRRREKGTRRTDIIYTVKTREGREEQPRNCTRRQNCATTNAQRIHQHVDNRWLLTTQGCQCWLKACTGAGAWMNTVKPQGNADSWQTEATALLNGCWVPQTSRSCHYLQPAPRWDCSHGWQILATQAWAKSDDFLAKMTGSEKEGLMDADSQSPEWCPTSEGTPDQEISEICT